MLAYRFHIRFHIRQVAQYEIDGQRGEYEVDYTYCKGCGICVAECPGHAFVLVNEREVSHV